MELICRHSLHTDRVWSLAWSSDGKYLASCSSDKTICIYGVKSGEWKVFAHIREAHTKTIRHVAWSPKDNLLACSSFDGSASIWEPNDDFSDFDCIATLPGHENEVKGVCWDSTGTLLATCGRDRTVWIWSFLPTKDGDREFSCVSVLRGHSQDVKNVKFHPFDQLLASCSFDNTIVLWGPRADGDEWDLVNTLDGHSSTVWDIDFTADGQILVSCSEDKCVNFWTERSETDKAKTSASSTWAVYSSLPTHPRTIFSVSVSTDYVATACADNAIRVFEIPIPPLDSEQSTLKKPIEVKSVCVEKNAHNGDVNSVAFCPTDQNIIASCGDDNEVKIWKLK